MFETALLANYEGARRIWTTMMGATGQCLLAGAAVAVPLLFPQVLPRPQTIVGVFLPASPPPPPARQSARAVSPERRNFQIRDGQLLAPVSIPAKVAMIEEPPAAEAGSGLGIPGGIPGGVPGGIPGEILRQTAALSIIPPEPVSGRPQLQEQVQPARIRVGGRVQQAKLLNRVMPAYPALARQARISGTVRLVGIIGTDGRIRDLELLGGHPLLVQAALEAVRQWRYEPTYLNGDPVEVVAPIDVTFHLQ